jgi:pimeloyl-ACP methyl ester carboxylesterase
MLLLLILGVGGWAAGVFARRNLLQQNPPPGRLVSVGGSSMHITCAGKGHPTVILEAGLGDFSVFWARVQPEVAVFTQVCAYDRAGLGWSEPGPRPRTHQEMVDDLHTLLEKAGVTGPYVLVGHSFGGINMRLFARRYPGEVAGMILVDSAHEQQADRFPVLASINERMAGQFRFLSMINHFGLMALFPEQVPVHGLPAGPAARYRARVAATPFFDAVLSESDCLYKHERDAPASLGALPLIVLSRGRAETLPGVSPEQGERFEQAWREMQIELAGLSSHSKHIIAEHSGHNIHLEQPDLVIEAARELVNYSR